MNSTFPPASVRHEVDKKSFFVYSYISLKELFLTVQRDYLGIIEKINIPFAIVFVILGYFSFESENFSFLIGVSTLVYLTIFLILLVQLAFRTKDFWHGRNVVFVENGFLMDQHFFDYAASEKIDKILQKYEHIFHERLLKPSKLKEVITEKREKIFAGVQMLFQKIFSLHRSSNSSNSQQNAFFFIALLFLGIYSVSLFFFYYIGVFLGAFFLLPYFAVLKILLLFQKPLEVLMKEKMEELDASLKQLENAEKNIVSTISTFVDGEISDISGITGTQFSDFYEALAKIVHKEKRLQQKIENSSYKNFFNIAVFHSYIRQKYNTPVENIVLLLEKSEENVSEQQKEIENLLKTEKKSEFSGPLLQKKQQLENMRETIFHQKTKFLAAKMA